MKGIVDIYSPRFFIPDLPVQLCPKRSQRYKLHWTVINERLRVINIFNDWQRLRYHHYKSFSFQKLRGRFKVQCRTLPWYNVEKPLQDRMDNNYIYPTKNDAICTAMSSNWVIPNYEAHFQRMQTITVLNSNNFLALLSLNFYH